LSEEIGYRSQHQIWVLPVEDISECCCKPVCYTSATTEKELLTMQLITNLRVGLGMAEVALVDYFVMGEAIGIVAIFLVSFYYSRKQMQKLSIDIETKILNDMDERIHELTRIGVERPKLMNVINNVHRDLSSDVPYAYHILYTFAHAYHMRQRGVVSDNEWTGWLRWMRNAFRHGTIKEIWETNIEAEKWFDPAFQDFITKEVDIGSKSK
jgi:hypothetical protein